MLTDLYVMDKLDGEIHKIGDNQHDSFWVDDDGIVHYFNLQNGDGCSADGWKNGKDSGYAFLPCGTYEMKYENFGQPDICLLDLKSKCNYPITECKDCPVRKEWKNEQSYVDNGQARELS